MKVIGWTTMAVATTVLAVGCRDESGVAGGWTAVTDTVGDTVVVRTTAGSVWGDTARLVEELRIGRMGGTDAYVLGDPVALAVGDGVVYVLDAQVPVVRVYDAGTGEYLHDVGREGAGPGEYRAPDGVAVLPDGRVLVRDPRTVHMNVYDADGTFLEAWTHPNQGGFHTYDRMWVDTGGVAYATTLLDWGVPPWEWERALIGVDATGQVTDTIAEPDLVYERADLTASDGNSASRRQVPFTGEKVWGFSPYRYMVAGITSRYAIYLFGPTGPVLRFEREAAPVPVQPEEAEERRVQLTRGLQRQYGGWRWNGPAIPDTKPPLRSLFMAQDGAVWVVVSRPGVPVVSRADAAKEEARTGRPVLRYREPPAFEVFDRTGRYLGPVAAPRALSIEDPAPVVHGTTVWGVERDAIGVPTVVRYRLVHEGAEGG